MLAGEPPLDIELKKKIGMHKLANGRSVIIQNRIIEPCKDADEELEKEAINIGKGDGKSRRAVGPYLAVFQVSVKGSEGSCFPLTSLRSRPLLVTGTLGIIT